MDTLTVAFLAEAIGNIKDEFSFYRTINISAVNTALKNIYKSLEWKKLGENFFSFSVYLCLWYRLADSLIVERMKKQHFLVYSNAVELKTYS